MAGFRNFHEQAHPERRCSSGNASDRNGVALSPDASIGDAEHGRSYQALERIENDGASR